MVLHHALAPGLFQTRVFKLSPRQPASRGVHLLMAVSIERKVGLFAQQSD